MGAPTITDDMLRALKLWAAIVLAGIFGAGLAIGLLL